MKTFDTTLMNVPDNIRGPDARGMPGHDRTLMPIRDGTNLPIRNETSHVFYKGSLRNICDGTQHSIGNMMFLRIRDGTHRRARDATTIWNNIILNNRRLEFSQEIIACSRSGTSKVPVSCCFHGQKFLDAGMGPPGRYGRHSITARGMLYAGNNGPPDKMWPGRPPYVHFENCFDWVFQPG